MYPLPSQILEQQFVSAIEEVRPEAIKIGAVGSAENLITIGGLLSAYCRDIPIVVDPVISATTGGNLASDPNNLLPALYKEYIFPLSTVVTPNLPEAINFIESFSDVPDINKYSVENAAERFLRLSSAKAVVLKGGHSESDTVADLLAVRNENETSFFTYLTGRIPDASFHGTGCVYSSLLASALSIGLDIRKAFLFSSNEIHQLILDNKERIFPNDSYPPLLSQPSVRIGGVGHNNN